MRKIDAFAHILPPSYARRLESIMSGPVSDRILGYQPWIHEDPALIDLSARDLARAANERSFAKSSRRVSISEEVRSTSLGGDWEFRGIRPPRRS